MKLISMGSHCYPAWLLRRMGNRDAAYPFDWIWSDPMMVVDCISDRFATFLDRKQHVRMQDNPRQSGHLIYGPRYGRPRMFNHHDITNDNDYSHYCRCVERFMGALASYDDARFVLLALPVRLTDQAFTAVVDALDAAGPNNSLIAIRLRGKLEERKSVLESEAKNAKLYGFHPVTWMQSGLSFVEDADNLAIQNLIIDEN